MSSIYIYGLLVLVVLADQLTTFYGIKKKEKESKSVESALTLESNLSARAVFKKYGDMGYVIMGLTESIVVLIVVYGLEGYYPSAPFFFLGFLIGVPFSNLYRTYVHLKNHVQEEIMRSVFVGLVLIGITLLILFGLSEALAIMFSIGGILFLIVSPFVKQIYEFLPHL